MRPNTLRLKPSREQQETAVNWLRELLRDWAKWKNGQLTESENMGWGYQAETPLSKAVSGQVSSPLGPSLPTGVIPPYAFHKVSHAMKVLRDDPRLGWYVSATRYFYLNGEDIDAVRAEFGCTSRSAAYALRERGEDAIRAFMRA